jgi:taurine dioxygenase
MSPLSEQALLKATDLNFDLLHLSPTIGTEVHGIDIGADLDSETIDFLSNLLVERKVIFFRDQDISVEQHIAFGRKFGEVEIHPFTPNLEGQPEVVCLNNDRDKPPSINLWHSDVTWRQEPSLGSILRALEIPEVGGDTLFANMEDAYESLDDKTKQQIENLYAVHDNENFLTGLFTKGIAADEVQRLREQYPPVTHPVVRTHPISGKKSLYVNTVFTRHIVDMDPDESQRLLEKLYLTAWIPDHQCRFRWRKNSFTFWDNRAAQHYAAADYWPEIRRMQRVTVIGDKPQ